MLEFLRRSHNPENPNPAPKETKTLSQQEKPKTPSQPEKLLNEKFTGAQALMLLGQEPPQQGFNIPRLDNSVTRKTLIEAAEKGISSKHKKKINQASFNERDEYWKARTDVTEKDRMNVWKKSMNAFLDKYKNDPKQEAGLTFLKKILKKDDQKNLSDVEVTADNVYNTFIQGEGKGDVEFYARRIIESTNNNIDEIRKNESLIKNLDNIFGGNSAKIAELLTQGIVNVKKDPGAFIKSAQENLDRGNYGGDIWVNLEKNNNEWARKEEEKKKGQIVFQKPPQQAQPERMGITKEAHPLVADAHGETRKGYKSEESPNQDDVFADPKHGAFGAFDGVGSRTYSADASRTAKTYIEQALSRMDENSNLETAEKQVEQALIGANNAVRENTEARYKRMRNDLEKNIAGKLTDKEFEEIYKKEYSSVGDLLRRIRDQLRAGKSAKITDEQDEEIWLEAMGSTTASVVKLWQGKIGNEEKKKAIIGNVGDSRVYRLHQGKIEAMTIDDNPLYLIVGNIEAKRLQDAEANGVKERELYKGQTVPLKESNPIHKEMWDYFKLHEKYQFNKNGEVEVPYSDINDSFLAKTLSDPDLQPNIQVKDISSGDRLVLATDGVHEGLLNKEMEKILNDPKYSDCGKAAKALIELASSKTMLTDDMTAVVVNIK